MGKASSMAIVFALVLPLLLLRLTSLVAAVDLVYYPNNDVCLGFGIACVNIKPDICCLANIIQVAAVQISNADFSVVSSVFRGEKCTGKVDIYRGPGCAMAGVYTGISWVYFRDLANVSETYKVSNTCKAQIKPTNLVYFDDSAKGQWVLTTNDATELFLQLENLPGVEVVDWLETHGATFESSGL